MENNKFINSGIILKSNLNKLTILDEKLGKITCYIKLKKNNLIQGAHLDYVLEVFNDYYYISNIKILNAPGNISKYIYHDLIFFHHVIEICYYFLPLNCNENISYIFTLILSLYENNIADNKFLKKLFLYNLFKILNIYFEYDVQDYNFMNKNYKIGIDLENIITLNNSLKRWLTLCISRQPYYNRLKTINFMKELDIYE